LTNYLLGWALVVMSGLMFLDIAHAVTKGAINFEGDWIAKSKRPVAFRWALGFEIALALVVLIGALEFF
jgi:hypothetical protein